MVKSSSLRINFDSQAKIQELNFFFEEMGMITKSVFLRRLANAIHNVSNNIPADITSHDFAVNHAISQEIFIPVSEGNFRSSGNPVTEAISEIDSRTPLTIKDMVLIEKAWEYYEEKWRENGEALLTELRKKYP